MQENPSEQTNQYNSSMQMSHRQETIGNIQIRTPYIKILEQPASKALRFRYECEGRSAGSIPGVHNTAENKTYPQIKIVGFRGQAIIVVSCVTKDAPHRAHPHNLVGKEGCKNGIYTTKVDSDDMVVTFQNLGIQCVKKRDIEDALKVREEKRVDPFNQGFSHKSQPNSIDLNCVRLCFQAFLPGSEPGKYNVLKPVVSEPIYDKKAMSDLVITRLSHTSASVKGGQEMILLCEKVAKEDIQIRFYEENNHGELIWEGYADFTPSQVHKQVAIWCKTPKYQLIEVDHKIKAYIQLKRPSDGVLSEPLLFQFTPDDSDYRHKRPKTYQERVDNPQISRRYQLSPQPMDRMYTVSPQHITSYPAVKNEPCPSPEYSVLATSPVAPRSPYNNNPTPSPSNYSPHYQAVNYPEVLLGFSNVAASHDMKTDQLAGDENYQFYFTEMKNDVMQQNYNFMNDVVTSVENSGLPNDSNIFNATDMQMNENQTRNYVALTSLEQKLDSRDLVRNLDECPLDANQLSQSFGQSLNITDSLPVEPSNMDDSLNRLVNEKADELCN